MSELERSVDPVTPIGEVGWREVVRVRGRVRSMRVQPWAGTAALEVVLYDETGGIVVVFTGRRDVPGIELGTEMEAEGRAGTRRGTLCLMNPAYRLHQPGLV